MRGRAICALPQFVWKGMKLMLTKEELAKQLQSVNVMTGGNRTKVLGRCLTQPFTTSNSAYRKLMFAIHKEHLLCVIHPERAYVSTGHETKFGERSSTFVRAETDLTIMYKIQKYPNINNHHYWLLTVSDAAKEIGVIERTSYRHTTESFGFLYNNELLDKLVPAYDYESIEAAADLGRIEEKRRIMEHPSGMYFGEYGSVSNQYADSCRTDACTIHAGEVIHKSLSYDSANNYMEGVNLLVAYLDENQLTEDPVELSVSAAKKFVTAEIKPIEIVINENDIPINLHGNDKVYKPLPDVGESITGNQLYCIRRENKEDSLFTQSIKNLSKPMMSDDSSPVQGMVVDIDVFANNPQGLESYYCQQLKYYSDNGHRYCDEFVTHVDELITRYPDYKMSHELETMYFDFKRRLEGIQFISSEKPFNNIICKITVVELAGIQTGDKVSNRYGGKGVVSKIVIKPDEEMPKLNGRHVDLLWRSSTGINRENAGQYKEVLLNNISYQILNHARTNYQADGNANAFMEEYLKFLELTNPNQAQKTKDTFYEYFTSEERNEFIQELCSYECFHVILDPVYQNIDLLGFDTILKTFPYVEPQYLTVPLKDCRGNIRWVKSHRPVGVGYEYIYMLKQKAAEKYSEASFSSINIKGDNTKDGNKLYRHLHKRTPIRMGHMENASLAHIGDKAVLTQAMLMGISPTGRMNAAEILTGDPFDINIRLTDKDMNRKAEIVACDLKGGMGLKLVFTKTPKKRMKFKHKLFPYSLYNSKEDPEKARARLNAFVARRAEAERAEAEKESKPICPFERSRKMREERKATEEQQ